MGAKAVKDTKNRRKLNIKSGDTVYVVAGKEKGKDAEWTFAVDDKTKVKKAGKEAMAKDIAPGDKVTVRYMEHEGKATATSVSASAAKKAAAEKK